MANAELGRIAGALRGRADPSDAELLDRFRRDRDDAAFAALVRRHGKAVLAACRHVVSDPATVDDCFQATFVVLLRRIAVVEAATMGSWLHAVAHRVAVRARADAARRRAREGVAAGRRGEGVPAPDPSWREAVAVLHEELDRLPDGYRLALLLCDLGGRSREEAAAELGWSPGAVKGRLERGRKLLARRLARRGISPSVTLLAAVTGNSVGAGGPPPGLVEVTVRAAAGASSPAVAALVRGVLPMSGMMRVGLAGAVLAAGLVVAGFGMTRADPPGGRDGLAPAAGQPPKVGPDAPRAVDDKTTDLVKMQGRWRLVDADDSDGVSKKQGFARHVMVVKGDEMWTESDAGGMDDRGRFQLGPDKSPKRIDFRTGGTRKDGQDRLGVYALDGDKLTICVSSVVPAGESRRPTDFAIKPGTGRVLLVYEREKPDPAAKEVVATFYRNLAAGKAKDNESLFRGPDVAVSGVFRGGGGPKAWRKTPAEYLAGHGNEQKYFVVDSVEVDVVHPGLAVARVKYRAGGYKGYPVLTLSVEGKEWRIASLYEETRFVW
jgi:RNA polymerase sigma-70 factor (ECF subfamily)